MNCDTTQGRWHVAVSLHWRDMGAIWSTAFYDDEFARTTEGRRIKGLCGNASAFAPFEKLVTALVFIDQRV
ncbi:hypothetical protein [Sphingobium sp. CR2-8]|uniref:hypothetical protein n=1 Tax=Sphingobium sp. CR2-8 TaxID=1306534 RepID=UPI003FA370AA